MTTLERHSFADAAQAKAYALAGNATLTFVSKASGVRFTYKIRASDDGAVHFVSLLNGPDNESNFTYLGYIRNEGSFWWGKKSKVGVDAPSVKAFSWIWRELLRNAALDAPDTRFEIWHEGRCGVCNRKLTVPASIASGIGPECAKRFSAEAV